MNNWLDFFNIFINGAALSLSVLGLWFSAIVPGIDRWTKRFFLNYFTVLLLCCFACFLEFVLYLFPVSSAAIQFILILESLLLSMPMPMLTTYLLHCCGENLRSSKLFHTVIGLWSVFFVLIISTPFSSVFTYIAPDKQFRRGVLYPLMLLPISATMLLNLIGTIRRRKQLSHKVFLSFLIALLPMTVTLLVNMFVDVFPLVDISYVLSALAMYSLILSEQIEQDLRHQKEIARQQQEIANQRASIMVLQMRPHFIYNTMTSIYCLCNQDPKKARQVVMDFTTYLRKNFNAIASSTTIPFSSELDHTRAYLAVEQAQYEDSLIVDFDTPHTWFRVPPLTLQPIVENAVKHGKDPYAGPFHISIQTRKTESGSEIIVADNGRGFSPAGDSEPHIALKNIQQRLEIMCGGQLTISANEGKGTVVTVTIPDSAVCEAGDQM